jgi:hypothetical protein
MLTIKVVQEDGFEYVVEAQRVMLFPAGFSVNQTKESLQWYKDQNDIGTEIPSGHVYVMNENGKTVAKYHVFTKNKDEK